MAHATKSMEAGKKMLVPLENNPQVMDALAYKLGLSTDFAFHDIYSIDDADLLNFIPRPAHALLMICPSRVYYAARAHEDQTIPAYDGSGSGEPVIWFRQTVGNICGLIALLHALANGARDFVKPDSPFDRLLTEILPLKPAARAQHIYDSDLLEAAHIEAASGGDTAPPPPEESAADGHFICFTKGRDGQLWELEGVSNRPLCRGQLNEEEDMLSQRALDMGVRRFLANAKGTEVLFSLVALVPKMD